MEACIQPTLPSPLLPVHLGAGNAINAYLCDTTFWGFISVYLQLSMVVVVAVGQKMSSVTVVVAALVFIIRGGNLH